MPEVAELVTQLLNGVVLGLLYAVIALGFMLILGTMEVINFAHGVLFALGGYFALALQPHVGWWGGLLLAPLGVGLVGLALERGVRRTYGKDPLFGLLFTFGAALALEEVIRIVWSPRGYTIVRARVRGGPLPVGVPRLLPVPDPRRGARGRPAAPGVVVPRADALRRHHEGRRPRQRDGAGARDRPRRACGAWCSRSGPRWPASPA